MKTRLLLPAIVLLLVFSACSNTRFGHVPKVKAKKQTAVAQKTPEKKTLSTPELLVAKKQTTPIANPNNEIEGNNNLMPSPLNITKEQAQTTVKSPVKTENSNGLRGIVASKQLKKLQKLEKKAATKESSHSWLWYVIVGLIFLLIGAILWGLVGYIFAVVGTIAIIYGLLVLLGIV